MHIWWTKLCVCAPGYLWRAKEWHNVRCLQENLYSAIFKQMTRKTTKEKHTEREREAKNPSEQEEKKTFMCVHFIFVPKNTDIMNLFLFKTRKMIIALYSVTNWTHFVRCLITVTMEIILNFVTYNDFVSEIFKRTEKNTPCCIHSYAAKLRIRMLRIILKWNGKVEKMRILFTYEGKRCTLQMINTSDMHDNRQKTQVKKCNFSLICERMSKLYVFQWEWLVILVGTRNDFSLKLLLTSMRWTAI